MSILQTQLDKLEYQIGTDLSSSSSSSMSICSTKYNEYLRIASDKNPSILLEIDIHGNVRYLSKVWNSIVGTNCKSIIGSPVSSIIVGNYYDQQVFQRAISMMTQDGNSYRVRFIVETGDSTLYNHQKYQSSECLKPGNQVLELEAQGILIYDSMNQSPTHSIWIVKPFCEIDELDNLPPDLLKRLGFGSKIFSKFLQDLEDLMVLDENDVPSPKLELCRVCETLVPAWWLESHSDMCICEHRIESAIQIIQDNLLDQKLLIENIIKSIESNDNSITHYKGYLLPIVNDTFNQLTPSSSIPFKKQVMCRKNSNSIFRTLRYPFKLLDLLEKLCTYAINVNTSELMKIDDVGSQYDLSYKYNSMYQFSPNTRQSIEYVINWDEKLDVSDPSISLLMEDTVNLARRKVESVMRLDSSMKYSLKIKNEVDSYVLQLIQERIQSNRINFMNIGFDESNNVSLGNVKGNNNIKLIADTPLEVPKITTPQPQRIRSDLFSDLYIGTDILPCPKSENFTGLTSAPECNNNSEHNLSSLTPKTEIENKYLITNVSIANSDQSNLSTISQKESSQMNTPKLNISTSLNFPKPNTSIALTPRRGSPISSISYNTPSSLIQRRSTIKLFHDKSPVSSPSLICNSTEFLTPDNNSSTKQPLSLLFLSTNSGKAPTPSIKDYDIIKPISKGAYGSVYLARKKLTGEYFAIKVLKKSDMIAKNQVTNVKSERAIMMVQSEKPYVAKLYASFQNKENLFLVMEYLIGGDLATLIKMMGCLPDKWAKQYISEVIIGVDDMHRSGIIHHDLKPDNLLIDMHGYVKLTDFGLSRMGLIRRHKKDRCNRNMVGKYDISRKNSIPPDDFTITSRKCSQTESMMTSSPLEALMRKNRTNSLTLEDKLTKSSMKGCQNDITSGSNYSDILNRKTERSNSNSSFLSNYDLPLLKRNGSQVSFSISSVSRSGTPPPSNYKHSKSNSISSDTTDTEPLRDLALFHPDDTSKNKRFFGTPDYLAPETIEGTGESGASDWWSVGCILFEFLLGYPPFHANSVEDVFKNILAGRIDWPEFSNEELESEYLSPEAKDLISQFLTLDPESRLGANGANEIKSHPYFKGIDWNHIRDREASFVPTVKDPEDTGYFDPRGANLEDISQSDLSEEKRSQIVDVCSPESIVKENLRVSLSENGICSNNAHIKDLAIHCATESAISDNIDNISSKVKYFPLSTSPYLREGRTNKLNDVQTEFGSFNYRNLSALDKANKETITRLKHKHLSENPHHHYRSMQNSMSASSPEFFNKVRASSITVFTTPADSLAPHNSLSQSNSNNISSALSSTVSNLDSSTDKAEVKNQDYSFVSSSVDDNLPSNPKFKSIIPSTLHCPKSSLSTRSLSYKTSISEFSVDESEQQVALSKMNIVKNKRKGSSKSYSGINDIGFNMDVLLCEPIPIHRYRLTKDLESFGCTVISVGTGDEIVRRATSGVKFDFIITAFKLPKIGAVDIAKLLRNTNSINCETPIIALTVVYNDADNAQIFDDILEKPIGMDQLQKLVSKYALLKSQKQEETIFSDLDV